MACLCGRLMREASAGCLCTAYAQCLCEDYPLALYAELSSLYFSLRPQAAYAAPYAALMQGLCTDQTERRQDDRGGERERQRKRDRERETQTVTRVRACCRDVHLSDLFELYDGLALPVQRELRSETESEHTGARIWVSTRLCACNAHTASRSTLLRQVPI